MCGENKQFLEIEWDKSCALLLFQPTVIKQLAQRDFSHFHELAHNFSVVMCHLTRERVCDVCVGCIRYRFVYMRVLNLTAGKLKKWMYPELQNFKIMNTAKLCFTATKSFHYRIPAYAKATSLETMRYIYILFAHVLGFFGERNRMKPSSTYL